MRKIIIIIIAITAISCVKKEKFDATGIFESTEIIISAEGQGRILSLNINEGDNLLYGQKVGAIDTVLLYLSKLQLEKNNKSVQVQRPDISKQIAATKAEIANQEIELKRIENLKSQGAATQKQFDDVKTKLEVLRSQLTAQKSSLQNSWQSISEQSSAIEIEIAQIENKLSKCHIISPINGTVLTKFAEAGEFATVGKPLFKIADLNNMYVKAYVTSAQLAKLKIGQKVNVIAQYGGDNQKDYKGEITWISSQSEFTPKNIQTINERADLVYAIKISVINDGYLKIGSYAEVNF